MIVIKVNQKSYIDKYSTWAIAGILGLGYLLYTEYKMGTIDFIIPITAVLMFIGFIVYNNFKEGIQVSEMYISDYEISLIYTDRKKPVKTVVITKTEIKEFSAEVFVDLKSGVREYNTVCTTNVCIRMNDGQSITFESSERSDEVHKTDVCHFILDLIRYSNSIPNFTYDIQGNDKETIKKIKNFTPATEDTYSVQVPQKAGQGIFLLLFKIAIVVFSIYICYYMAHH